MFYNKKIIFLLRFKKFSTGTKRPKALLNRAFGLYICILQGILEN